MSVGLYSHTTRAVGTILTAAIYNSDHQNHITNANPSMTGAYSDSLSEHQLVSDPGGLGTEVLAANLAVELEQLRFCLKRITGKAQWYIAPAVDLESVGGTVTDLVVNETVVVKGTLSPAQITANQNNYAPTNFADAFHLRLSVNADRDMTGLAGGGDGRIIIVTNISALGILTLKNEDAASTAANRFSFPTANIPIKQNESLILRYDVTSSRWLAPGFPGGVLDATMALKENLGEVSGVEVVPDANYTFVLADKGKVKEGNSASARNFTVPPNSSVAFPVKTVINVVQIGAGQITLVQGGGVTIKSANGLKLSTQFAVATLYKRGTDDWVVSGSVTT